MKGLFLDGSVGAVQYLSQAFQTVKPLWIGFISIASYILFPTEAYYPAATALIGAMTLDIITKIYSLIRQSKGLKNAFLTGNISSSRLWNGTARKIISYLVIMILCGLSLRVTPMESLAVAMSTFFYSCLFVREAISSLENLRDAGHKEVEIFIFWLKRKEKKLLDEQGIAEKDAPIVEDKKVSTNTKGDEI